MFERLRDSHGAFGADAAQPAWLAERRAHALATAETHGLPNTKLEAWKYTSTRSIAQVDWTHGVGDAEVSDRVDAARLPHASAELVFVDGVLDADASRGLDGAVSAFSLAYEGAEALLGAIAGDRAPEQAFSALNTAFLQDGLVLRVPKNTAIDGPIHVITVASGGETAAHLRHLLVLEPGAAATVVETYIGADDGAGLVNTVVEADVGANAALTHLVVGQFGASGHLVHTLAGRIQRDGRHVGTMAWLGGALTRSTIDLTLAGPGAELDLDGLFVLGERQHVDNHIVVTHQAPRCASRQTYKGALGGRAKGVFDGRVVVAQDAQHTDASQASHNLLLTDTADANAKPALEIYADDVKCAHGTTVGQLDANQLWYLRSRGISEEDARHVLTQAFVSDRVVPVRDEVLRERLQGFVDAKLTSVVEAG